MGRMEDDVGITEETGLQGNEISPGLDVLSLVGEPSRASSRHWVCEFVRPGDRAETVVQDSPQGEGMGPWSTLWDKKRIELWQTELLLTQMWHPNLQSVGPRSSRKICMTNKIWAEVTCVITSEQKLQESVCSLPYLFLSALRSACPKQQLFQQSGPGMKEVRGKTVADPQ